MSDVCCSDLSLPPPPSLQYPHSDLLQAQTRTATQTSVVIIVPIPLCLHVLACHSQAQGVDNISNIYVLIRLIKIIDCTINEQQNVCYVDSRLQWEGYLI